MSWPPNLAAVGLDVQGDGSKWAALSACDRYRYMLGRAWDTPTSQEGDFGTWERPLCVWMMLNPSTADHAVDDPTIRKCVGFSERLGCGGLVVVNLFAWRATDPEVLVASITEGRADVAGPKNDAMIEHASALSPMIVGWGKVRPAVRARAQHVWSLGSARRWPMHCLGVNDDGSPRHPLYVPYEVKPLALREARENLRAGFPHGLRPEK